MNKYEREYGQGGLVKFKKRTGSVGKWNKENHRGRMVWASCERKHRYNSEHDAKNTIHRIMKVRPGSYRVYFCDNCRGWHITKKST